MSTRLGDLFDAAVLDPSSIVSPVKEEAEAEAAAAAVAVENCAVAKNLAPAVPAPFASPVAPPKFPRPSMMLIEGLTGDSSSTDTPIRDGGNVDPVYSAIDRGGRTAGKAVSSQSNGYDGATEVIYDNVIPTGANVISFMSPVRAIAPALPPRNTPQQRPHSVAVINLQGGDEAAPSKPPRKNRPASEDFDLRITSPVHQLAKKP